MQLRLVTNGTLMAISRLTKLEPIIGCLHVSFDGHRKDLYESIRVGATGRNLFTFTNYSGYDPEVSSSGESTNQFYDSFSYPNFRTYTGSLEFTF